MTKLQDLEKRVTKLEEELNALKNTSKHISETPNTTRSTRKAKKKNNKLTNKPNPVTKPATKKRKVNEYFKMMLEAKKAGKPSFIYKGSTYKGTKHEKLGMIYKKA